MNRYLTTLVLTLALSVSALAGEIPSVPGPPPPRAAQTANAPGDIPTGGFAQEITDEFLLIIFSMFAR